LSFSAQGRNPITPFFFVSFLRKFESPYPPLIIPAEAGIPLSFPIKTITSCYYYLIVTINFKDKIFILLFYRIYFNIKRVYLLKMRFFMIKKTKFYILLLISLFLMSCSEEPPKIYQKKQIVKTDYFSIIVHSFKTSNEVNTNNPFTDLSGEDGILYVIIDISFKNIDKESRMIMDGDLILIGKDNKEYVLDKSETVLAEGFGVFLDQINPLLTKRTKLIYKIPKDFIGKIYYKPARNSENARIYLGNKS
jgi:hypothetical protein